MPSTLQAKIEQVIRLIRSKGVGVYFVTQNPLDVPEVVLGQLGNRVQHALRAFTPNDQKAVRAAAQTFRTNPKLNVETVITELAVGEGLVSFLDEKGTPGVVERALICPPHSQIGPITPEQRQQIIRGSVVFGVYEKSSRPRIGLRTAQRQSAAVAGAGGGPAQTQPDKPWYENLPSSPALEPRWGGGRRGDTVVDAMMKSAARSIGSSVGRQIIRGVLGSLLGGSSRR